MISKVSFRSFKSLREVDIDFSSRLTVLVGPNASGKTSVLQGISLAAKLMASSESEISVSDALICRLSQAPLPLSIEVFRRSADASVSEVLAQLDFKPSRGRNLATSGPVLRSKGNPSPLSKELQPLAFAGPLYRFDLARLAKPAVLDPVATTMDETGGGLAAVLADLATADPLRFAEIIDAFRKIIPIVKQVRLLAADMLRPVATVDSEGNRIHEMQLQRGYRLAFDLRGAERVPVEQVSEGTLLTLGWLTAVMAHGWRWLFLLDDIDRGLHPKAQRELVGILRSLLEQNPNYQIIATTHSPYLLDLLTPEEVRIVSAAEDGATLCGTLMEHPEFARWKDLMLPGEMWSTVGEEWLRDQRAKQDASAQ